MDGFVLHMLKQTILQYPTLGMCECLYDGDITVLQNVMYEDVWCFQAIYVLLKYKSNS